MAALPVNLEWPAIVKTTKLARVCLKTIKKYAWQEHRHWETKIEGSREKFVQLA